MASLTSVLFGCASQPASAPTGNHSIVFVSRCPEVHVGMSFDQVTSLLGEPVKKYTEAATTTGTMTGYVYAGRNVVLYMDGKVHSVACAQGPQTSDRPSN